MSAPESGNTIAADVVVVGDGPAGSALAAALHRVLGAGSVVLVGPDDDWPATYGTWTDDVDACTLLDGADVFAHRTPTIRAHFTASRTIPRAYGVIDNECLRDVLRAGIDHRRQLVSIGDVDARVVIDATGWPSRLQPSAQGNDSAIGWQTAWGLVLAEPPDGPLGSETLMDFSDPVPGWSDALGVPTFAYALPVHDGWLVEETVLVSHPAVAPDRLRERLAARLGLTIDALTRHAVRTESVRIPMGAPHIPAAANVVRYGAAAGMINPATGYSVAASLCNADAVAGRISSLLESGRPIDTEALDEAVWPRPQRRTRLLHDYGLDVMEDLDAVDLRTFFDRFFDLSTSAWASYFRIDTKPADMAKVMASMFRAADWRLRRQLATSNPSPFVRMLRP